MNIENKKQMATILLAVGLGLVASMLMSKVVSDSVDKQTKAIANEYKRNSAALVKEIDTTKKQLGKLSSEYAALAKRVDTRPMARPAAARKRPSVQKAAFSLQTPPGKRALTMKIDSLAAVGGLVNPGDFVDIIAHLDSPKKSELKGNKKDDEKVITVLFQDIQVLAVGTNYNPEGIAPPYEAQKNLKALNVTFAVGPDEASLLAFAQANGSLRLALRSPGETQGRILQEVASWDVLADFVLERQGTELRIPGDTAPKKRKTEKIEELEPFIQIFRGGREL